MADLRMIAVLAAACSSAKAQPEPAVPVAPPSGWQALPAAEAAAKAAAAGPGVTVDDVRAWSEPRAGCYALWFSLRGGATAAETLAKELVDGLTAEKFVASESNLANGVIELAVERAPYKGRLRARLGGGQVAGLACVANQRDPSSCEAPCKTMLGAIQ